MGSIGGNVGKKRASFPNTLTNETVPLLKKHIGTKSLCIYDLPIVKISAIKISIIPDIGRLAHASTAMPVYLREPTVLGRYGKLSPRCHFPNIPVSYPFSLKNCPRVPSLALNIDRPIMVCHTPVRFVQCPDIKAAAWESMWGHMIICEPDRFIGKLIGMGSLDDWISRATQVSVPLVIRDHNHDIWLIDFFFILPFDFTNLSGNFGFRSLGGVRIKHPEKLKASVIKNGRNRFFLNSSDEIRVKKDLR